MHAGSTLVVMSSIPVETARAQAERACAELAVHYIDAPVSGGEKGAREGTLAIMAGGEADRDRGARRCVRAAGPRHPCRAGGSGELAKLANQLIVASNICAVAEALVLAERGGADPAKVREALLGGFADSTVFRQHGQRMVEGNFVPGGPAKYQVKDTGTALALARHARSDACRSPNEVDRLFRSLVDHGGGDLDHSAAIAGRLKAHERNRGGRSPPHLNCQSKWRNDHDHAHNDSRPYGRRRDARRERRLRRLTTLTLSTPDPDTSEITVAANKFAELVAAEDQRRGDDQGVSERHALRRRPVGRR